jgi:hypothetical protein
MDTDHPGDALAGLLLLQGSNDSNNDRENCSRTSTTDDSNVTPASNNIGPTPTSNDSMDVPPASPVVETKPKRRTYTKRGGTSFIQKMGSMKAKYTYQATVKPRAAKQSANVAITALLADTSSNQTVDKLNIEEEQKLVHLYYIKIGSPPPEDWRGKGGAISRIIAALEMTANECRKVERVIHKTYHSLRNGEIYDESRSLRQNETAIADGSKIQQLVADYRETGLSYSETAMVFNLYCIEKSLPTVTRSAVVSCEKRMVKEILPIIK